MRKIFNQMKETDRKKIIKCYNNLINYYLIEKGELEIFENNPFNNFMQHLDPFVQKLDFYNSDIYVDSVIYYLTSILKQKQEYGWVDIEDLIDYINEIFVVNKKEHYLIFPLERSELKNDISFGNYIFLTKRDTNDLCQKISDITSIPIEKVKDDMDHTIKSRSPDFIKNNMLIIKIEQQTENVRYLAYWYAQYTVYFLRIIFGLSGLEQNIFLKLGAVTTEPNRHVQILSQDAWRCGHGFNYDADFKCNINLNFMNEEQYQVQFIKLVDSFVLAKEKDALTYKFQNALNLMMKGHLYLDRHDDDTVALLLYIASLESLFKDRMGDIKIRLAVTIPRIVKMDVANFIGHMYNIRNNFMHAGKRYYDDKENIEKLEKICYAMIMQYINCEEIFAVGQDRLKSWENHLDEIFNKYIFAEISAK